MTMHLKTTADVVELHNVLSNWGRWGWNDEKGAFNYITTEKVVASASLVESGRTVSCGRIIQLGVGSNPQSNHVTFRDPDVSGAVREYIGFIYHGPVMTQMAALGHIFHDGSMYNGFVVDDVVGLKGPNRCDVGQLKEGIVTRGVLFDIPRLRGLEELEPGDMVRREELERAEAVERLEVGAGDVVLVRTGFGRAWLEGRIPVDPDTFPGCHADCLSWLYERCVSVVGSDGINDVVPSGFEEPVSQPIHWVGVRALGIWVLDNADLEELARVCEEERRWEFQFVIAPLAVTGGTGSPVNPVACF